MAELAQAVACGQPGAAIVAVPSAGMEAAHEFERAYAFFQKALVIRPHYPLAVLGLIEIDFKRSDLRAAKANITSYMQTYPLAPESLWLAIQIERAIGDHQAEASYAFQLQRRFPDSSEAMALREGRLNHER